MEDSFIRINMLAYMCQMYTIHIKSYYLHLQYMIYKSSVFGKCFKQWSMYVSMPFIHSLWWWILCLVAGDGLFLFLISKNVSSVQATYFLCSSVLALFVFARIISIFFLFLILLLILCPVLYVSKYKSGLLFEWRFCLQWIEIPLSLA